MVGERLLFYKESYRIALVLKRPKHYIHLYYYSSAKPISARTTSAIRLT